jgi:hypothetical protein
VTVIAYRDGVLAGDTQHTINGVIVGHGPKVFKHNGWLFGSCGDAGWDDEVRRVIEWVADQRATSMMLAFTWPDFPADFSCLVVSPAGEVSDIGRVARWSPFACSFMAIGCGGEIAAGAMDQGADAREACRAAMRRHTGCGGDVVAVSLDAADLCRRVEGRDASGKQWSAV